MTMHRTARRGFEREAEAYERGRPEYPPDAVDWLVERVALAPGRVVVDVGAGTGKLARALLPSGAEVVAVEPVAAMREVLARQTPGVRALSGTAEALPFADGTVDALVVGQAFHWFDAPAALAEFHRVLRAGGRFGLIWNRRRLDQPVQRAIDEIITPYRGATPSQASGSWRHALEQSSLFAQVGEFEVPFEQQLDADQLIDRVASISFIAALEGPSREDVLARLRRLAATHSGPLSYVSEVFVFERQHGDR